MEFFNVAFKHPFSFICYALQDKVSSVILQGEREREKAIMHLNTAVIQCTYLQYINYVLVMFIRLFDHLV